MRNSKAIQQLAQHYPTVRIKIAREQWHYPHRVMPSPAAYLVSLVSDKNCVQATNQSLHLAVQQLINDKAIHLMTLA